MAQRSYLSVLPVFIDNVSQVDILNTNIEVDPAKVRITTRAGIGFAQGTGAIMFTFEAAVTKSGPEFDAMEATMLNREYELLIPYGGKSIVSKGQFTKASLSSSVNEATKQNYSFEGSMEAPV